MTPAEVLVWSQNDLANQALRTGHAARVASYRSDLQQRIYDRMPTEHKDLVAPQAAAALRDATWLMGEWARLSSALEVFDPVLAGKVDAAVWGQRTVAERRAA